MLKREFQNIFSTLLYGIGEKPSETKKDDLIKAREILTYLQEREKIKKALYKPYLNIIKSYLPDIDYIELKGHKQLALFLYYTNEKFIILNHTQGATNILNISDNCIDTNLIEFIKNEQKTLNNLVNCSIENKFTDEIKINTISNLFRIQIDDDSLIVSPSCIYLPFNFYLTYCCYQKSQIYNSSHKIIDTDIGKFVLECNIPSIKNKFLKPLNKSLLLTQDEINPTLRFINNLKVYKNDLTCHIQNGIQKIKK